MKSAADFSSSKISLSNAGSGQGRAAFARTSLGCSILLATVSPFALAEDRDDPMEEIVVTATPIESVGISANKLVAPVQQLSADDLERTQAQSIAEHLRYQLGSVTINEAINNNYQPDVQYRGFTASPLLGLPQGVSVYMNGIRVNEPFGDAVNWDLIPTDAVSSMALHSGSNPLFGQNTLGGSLSMATKDGFDHAGNELELGAGQYGYRQAQFQSGGSRWLDKTAGVGGEVGYFLLLNGEKEDGWRDHSGSNIRQAMTVLSWRNDDSELDFTALVANNRMTGNGAVPAALMELEGREAIYTQPDQTENRLHFFALDGEHWLSDDLQLAGNLYLRSNLTNTLNGDDSDYEECLSGSEETLCEGDDDQVGEAVEFVGYDDASLEAIAAELGLDVDADELDGTLNTSRTEQDSLGLSLQLSSSAPLTIGSDDLENLLAVGFSYDQAEIDFRSRTEFAVLRNDSASDDRGVSGIGLYDAESEVHLKTRSRNLGLFVTDTLSVTEQLSLTAGARYNHTHIRMDDQLEDGEGSLNGNHSFRRINPMLGAAYELDAMNLYASYSEASRAPTPAELSCADENDPCKLPNGFVSDPPLKQVVTRSWEAGVRSNAGQPLRWSAGVFRSTNHDDILFQQAGGLPSEGYFSNVGKTRRQGIELGLVAELEAVRLAAAYTWMKATFETPFVSFSPNNPQGTNRQVEAGDNIPGLPDHVVKLAADWQALDELSVGADLQYRSSQYFRGDEANENAQLAGYAIVNLRAGWEPSERLEVYGRVVNVFDREYETFGVYGEADEVLETAYPGFDEDRFVGPGAPRTFKAGIKVAF
ncbi:TonB-dependent receptor [Oceanobacter mangrovi]|uniref:TonB-dependent receptor n=1 Tax=Oceanobacter mangrovi TaxID=2862510 RepID=UPI001C8E41EB|nr:TonB-dependent receptor [Oceanobacter mangrovi]